MTAYSLSTSGNIGTVVTVTDQAGKQRRSITNGLGQLVRVDEPDNAGNLGSISSPNQPTNYAYDPLNNLTTVIQGVQTRTFVYDSLSRLKTATNPESGLIQYAYDPNGNLTTKTDARGVVTTYAYDAINRATQRSYSTPNGTPANYQATPNVTYTYDDLPNSKGKLTKVTNGSSTTEYQVFDAFGRVTQSQQWVDGVSYGDPMTYTYNLSGSMIEQKYPSGRVVKNVLDNDGDLSIVRSKKNADSGYWDYAKGFTYTAAGAVGSMQLGNGRWESTVFNSRLQPTQIALGTVQNGTDKLKLNFTYNTTGQNDNNGNVLSQTITVPTETRNNQSYAAFTAVQTYTYDSLNRIKDAKEMIGAAQQWRQTFDYDRYGNRRFDIGTDANGNKTTTLPPGCPTAVCNPTIDPATNKLIGYSFDNAGNTKLDAENRQFIYDGENKQVEVKDQNGASIGKYSYNGDGQRVKKLTATESTVFVYNASGQLVAEYATQIAQTADAKVSYLTTDHLGSPRITTDANGQVISRRDFQPFGEEIARAGYGTDAVRQKFTTYERDNETDLDYAEARVYANRFGRFTTVDPYYGSAYNANPQSWNRYSYVLNRPLIFVDPTGLIWVRGNNGSTVWFTEEEWEGESQRVGDSGNPYWRVLQPSEFEFDSVDGRVRLDPNGPSADNPGGWSIVGPNQGSGALMMAGGALVVSQADSPAPGPADVLALVMLASAAYSAIAHEELRTPLDPNIWAQNTKQIKKVVDGLIGAAERELEKLRKDGPNGRDTNHHKGELKAMLDRAKKVADRLVGKAKEKALEKIKKIEETIQEIAPDN